MTSNQRGIMSVVILKSSFFSIKPRVWVDGDSLCARTPLLIMLLCLFFYRKKTVINRKTKYIEVRRTIFWVIPAVEMIPFRNVDHISYDYANYPTSGGAFATTTWRNDEVEIFSVGLVLSKPKGAKVPLFKFQGEGAVETGLMGAAFLGDSYLDFMGDQESASFRFVDLLAKFIGTRVGEKLPEWNDDSAEVAHCPKCGRPARQNKEKCFVCGTPIVAMLVLIVLSMAACSDKAPPARETSPPPAAAQVDTTPREPAPTPVPAVKVFADAGNAMAHILSTSDAKIIGFGEFHQTNDTTSTLSALDRFTSQILPIVKSSSGNLVVETWINEGNCGEKEKEVHKNLDKTTERPKETETEVVKLMKAAKESGVEPHILKMKCTDYDRLMQNDGKVDYWEFLELITRGLEEKARTLVLETPTEEKKRTVIIYGGAIHNDMEPYEDLAPYSFAKDLHKATDGGFLEVDLYVPEFVKDKEQLQAEPWFPVFKEHVSPRKVLLIERSPSSYIIVFKEGVKSPPALPRK